jgi:hypothetical protein
MAWQVLDDKAVLIDLDAGVAASFNATGTHVWRLLEEGLHRDALVARVADAYRISLRQSERDVGTFLDLLEEKGWIEARAG